MIPSRGTSPLRDGIILGINIGKNKDTSNDLAEDDYLTCMRLFYDRVDYIAINVSSPNTLGLRDLQGKVNLSKLLKGLVAERNRLRLDIEHPLPLFVKLAPDLNDQELDDALEAVADSSVDGIIATNTTVQRKGLIALDPAQEGGLSGKPLRDLSTGLIIKINKRTAGKIPIIGVGGIGSVADAREKINAGASLVQVYSGMIFKGPGLVRELVESL
jgi:dihydroorotate dehydrogenase